MGSLVLIAGVDVWLLATGGGPPPGAEYDREDLEEMSGDGPAAAHRDDPAP
jgi:hypothetical protein